MPELACAHPPQTPPRVPSLAIATCALLAVLGCDPAASRLESRPAPSNPPPGSRAAAFSAERAWEHLEALVGMGPRAPGHPGHARARRYLVEQLQAAGARVEELPFHYQGAADPEPVAFVNVSGLFGERTGGWVLLGTHYDTRIVADEETDPARRAQPIPGANDGGSGVAVLLEIARVLGEQPPPFGVELVFFDAEDWGHASREDYIAGSRDLVARWSELGRTSWPSAVIVVDMVGDADLSIAPERSSDRELVRRIWRAARRLGADAFTTRLRGSVIDDHTPFVAEGVPAALLIDFEYPAWHTLDDDLSQCSPESLATVGRVVLSALFDAEAR